MDKKRAFPVTKKVFSRVPVPEKDGEKKRRQDAKISPCTRV